jgi:hypothetical protein
MAQYVRIDIQNNWSGGFINQYGLSEVQFLSIPISARNPSPVSGATEVAVDSTLTWIPGREASEHTVYFGEDESAVMAGTAPAETVTQTDYLPSLVLDTTYYWRVDAVSDTSVWPGSTWSFTTADQVVVDDFESYSNYSPNRVFQTWVDGIGFDADDNFPNGGAGNGSGSLLGHDIWFGDFTSIMEKDIVYSGSQSMPVYYDGAGSQVDLSLANEDWTGRGITTLVIHFYGTADNTGQLYVKIGNTKISYPGVFSDISAETWIVWEIDLAASGASLNRVSQFSVGVDGVNAGGLLYIDDILLQ